SKFEFEFKRKGKFYAYGFELDTPKIHSEWLYEISKTSEKVIFERRTSDDNETTVEFGKVDFKGKKDRQFVEFTGMGTRYNQLFLTESIERGLKHFEDAFFWFDKVLTFIFPGSQFADLEMGIVGDKDFSRSMLKFLQLFDTGISGISFEKIDFDDDIMGFPDGFNEQVEDLEIDQGAIFRLPDNRRYIVLRDEHNELLTAKLMTKHTMKGDDEEALLEISDESDGTQRLMELIPALIDLLARDRVYVIDELDRSLHLRLSYKILELFLNNKQKQASQLIVTTHESSLLNLNLLRRDEIWFIEKDKEGASCVYSLEEFAPRYDKDVRKGYLLGRFGAIPIVPNVSDLGWVS
ncbi:MAG: ATP-binding protein, partial [candidate division Zixibacteria bacterium]|nr:ATP-binding protein [candidate division Zixibacteria bacterium]